MKLKIDNKATLAVLGTLLFWSTGPNFVRLLSEYMDSWSQNMFRYWAACLFWLPFLIISIRKGKVQKNGWKLALIPAAANVVMQGLWAECFYFIKPGLMILISKSSMLWIACFSIIAFQAERPLVKSKWFWSAMILSVIGLTGVLSFNGNNVTETTLKGIIMTLVASVLWAVYTISVKITLQNTDSRIGFSIVSIYTTAGFTILAVIFGHPGASLKMTFWPWSAVIISGITSIGICHTLYYSAIRRIGATIPSLALLATPFTVLAISHLAFGENLTAVQLLFGFILLSGSAIAIFAQQNLKPPDTKM
ncbi:MAG: DMT family transporter [Candidatus Brocadiia bacterium]|nr:MAG: DMT family transporter [Candidatus Brocadiia bacterium]